MTTLKTAARETNAVLGVFLLLLFVCLFVCLFVLFCFVLFCFVLFFCFYVLFFFNSNI